VVMMMVVMMMVVMMMVVMMMVVMMMRKIESQTHSGDDSQRQSQSLKVIGKTLEAVRCIAGSNSRPH